MLTKTFCHVPGLGVRTERSLWEQGCEGWDCFLDDPSRYRLGTASQELAVRIISESREALARREHQYFAKCLNGLQTWRAYGEFKDSCLFLDIETDGGTGLDSITVIGVYDGTTYRCLLRDDNLFEFNDYLSHFSMIVTYFGNGFDIPVLKRCFPSARFDQIHVDLCPTMRLLGYRGGLKGIERALGIRRSPETDGLNGYDAVRLWRMYSRFENQRALDTLVAYNREDVVHLKQILELAFRRLSSETLHGHLRRGRASGLQANQ